MNEFLPIIRKASLFSGVSEEALPAMLGCLSGRLLRVQADERLVRAGEEVDSLGLLLEGRALVVQEDFWGNRNLISAVEPGQPFAETFACVEGARASVSVLAEQPCTALMLEVRRVLTVCPVACAHHSRMIRNLLSGLADSNLCLNEKLTHLGQRGTRAKLLSYLSAEAQRQGSARFTIPFSRQQLADFLSVERSGLSRELSQMAKEGLLTYHKNFFHLHEQ